jgi:hypothetical protein
MRHKVELQRWSAQDWDVAFVFNEHEEECDIPPKSPFAAQADSRVGDWESTILGLP